MNTTTRSQLDVLNEDFRSVTGATFDYFYCPILYNDDSTELALGHIIPRSFANSSRSTVVQRKDVDGFYGHFEAIFEQIQSKNMPHDELLDHRKAGLLKPKLILDGCEIETYPFNAKNQVPDHHTLIGTFENGLPVPWRVIKMVPEAFDAHGDLIVSFVDADFRIPALISCLKAAHLTMFRLLGYTYVFNKAGFFLGRTILGNFFDETKHLRRGSEIFSINTINHFTKYQNMVRPVEKMTLPVDITGTIADRMLLVCWDDDDHPWAILVFVRFGSHLNGVLVPSGGTNHSLYNQFLNLGTSFDLNVSVARFRGSAFEVDTNRFKITWPKANLGEV